MIDLTALWHQNRRWRSWMDANTKFVTPAKKLVTLQYMDGETREVRDLIIRQELPDHARNNGRDSTIEQELADVVMLALTALDEPPSLKGFQMFDVDWMCHNANGAVMALKVGVPGWIPRVHWTISRVLAYPGLDLPVELDWCWRRLAWKHGKSALMALWREQGLIPDHAAKHIGQGDTWSNAYYPAPWLVEETE